MPIRRKTRRRQSRLRRKQRGGLDWNTVNMNRYESNANYRRSIKAQNKRNYNAVIAQGVAALRELGVNTSQMQLPNIPNNENENVSEEELEQEYEKLKAEIEAANANNFNVFANITKNGRKFINLSPEEMSALNDENSEALSTWLMKEINKM